MVLLIIAPSLILSELKGTNKLWAAPVNTSWKSTYTGRKRERMGMGRGWEALENICVIPQSMQANSVILCVYIIPIIDLYHCIIWYLWSLCLWCLNFCQWHDTLSFLSILLCFLYPFETGGNKSSIGCSNRLILATGGSWPAAFCIFSSGPIHGRSVTDIGWHSHLLKAWG